MIHFESEHVTLRWDDRAKAVLAEWLTGPPTSAEFREALESGLRLLIERSAENWIADTRKLVYPSREDEGWSVKDWFPRAQKAGLKRLAMIMPADSGVRLSVHGNVTVMANAGITTAYFASVSEAREWLASAK